MSPDAAPPPEALRFVPYDPEVERIRHDEGEVIAQLDGAMASIREKTFQDTRQPSRSVHAKAHGALVGRLRIEPDLPAAYAQGLFAQAGEYDALLRISTVPGDMLPDSVSLPRGLALKITGVPGERLPGSEADGTQNFLFVDAPAFSVGTPAQFVGKLRQLAATTDRAEGAKKLLSSVAHAAEKVVEALGGQSQALIGIGGHPRTEPLGQTYYTAVPHRHGAWIAKYRLLPLSEGLKALTDRPVDVEDSPDALRESTAAFMREHPAEWALQAQLCVDLKTQPVEDASVVWPESLSPFVTVARLQAPAQCTWNEGLARWVDDELFFSPWRGLAAHRPLGAIMRARRLPYEHSAAFRAARLGLRVAEPENLDRARALQAEGVGA